MQVAARSPWVFEMGIWDGGTSSTDPMTMNHGGVRLSRCRLRRAASVVWLLTGRRRAEDRRRLRTMEE